MNGSGRKYNLSIDRYHKLIELYVRVKSQYLYYYYYFVVFVSFFFFFEALIPYMYRAVTHIYIYLVTEPAMMRVDNHVALLPT